MKAQWGFLCWTMCQAIRNPIGSQTDLEVERAEDDCSTTATLSDFDLRSLNFSDPKFSFLHSREFFLAETAACDKPVQGMKLLKVKKSLEAKRAQLAQRFKVKQVKTMSKDALQSRFSTQMVKEAVLGVPGDEEHAPAVELHMFPEDPRRMGSRWQVLLVPSVKEVFQKTLFLCRREGFRGSVQQDQQELDSYKQCVARLPFEALPFHLSSMVGLRRLQLDRLRSTPNRLVLLLEAIILSGIVLLAMLITYTAYLLTAGDAGKPGGQAVKEWTCPCEIQLAQHAVLYKDELGELEALPSDPLDAGARVVVLETRQIRDASVWSSLVNAEWWGVYGKLMGQPKFQVWGRLEEPSAWVLLAKEDEKVPRVVEAEGPGEELPRALLRVNEVLMPPIFKLLRNTLILFAAHASAQWLLVEYFSKLTSFASLMLLVFGMVAVHILVLFQQNAMLTLSLQYEEILQTEQKLLQLVDRSWQFASPVAVFIALEMVMCATVLATLVAGGFNNKAMPQEFGFLIALALHAQRMYEICAARGKWREPQVETKELYTAVLQTLPSTTEKPSSLSSQRRKKLALSQCLTRSLSLVALVLAARVALDVLQLCGELVDYGTNRGKFVYPTGSHALHNTLLLDQKADSLTLNVELGVFTGSVVLQLEHPLFNEDNNTNLQVLNQSGELLVALPDGPLYSRLTLIAVGDYVNTTYMIHILRVGQAVGVALRSPFNTTKYPELVDSVFEEERRLEYQINHRIWHTPDLELSRNATLLVSMTSLVFAPLDVGGTVGTTQLAEKCQCQPEKPGFGNMCLFEQQIQTKDVCPYQRSVDKEVHPHLGEEGMAGVDSRMLGWLQDTAFSGKSVKLTSGAIFKVFNALAKQNSSTTARFQWTGSLDVLQEDGTLLEIMATQDPTSSETVEVPIMVVPSAPQPVVHVNCSAAYPGTCFLLPNATFWEMRDTYAICGSRSDVDHVWASVPDSRFEVIHSDVQKTGTCFSSQPDTRREFRSVRRQDSGCGNWCQHYLPRGDTYDVAVDRSPKECLKLAVAFQDVGGLQHSTLMIGEKDRPKCMAEGWLGQAIRANFSGGVEEILNNKVDADFSYGGVSPLQIAAAEDNIHAMQLLIKAGANVSLRTLEGSTALGTAGSQCRLRALKYLLEQGAPTTSKTCSQSPLVEAVTRHARNNEACQQRSKSIGQSDPGSNRSIIWDVVAALQNISVQGEDCRGAALEKALQNADLMAVEAVLDGVDSVDGLCPELAKLLQRWWSSGKFTDTFFMGVLPILVAHRMDMADLLPWAALKCKVEFVKHLLGMGANPSSTLYKKTARQWAEKKCVSDKNKILALIDAKLKTQKAHLA